MNQLLADVEREQADAKRRSDEADRDRKFAERLERIRLERFEKGDKWIPKETDAAYAAAFREFDIDVNKLDPAEAGRRLKERSNPMELAFFLDDWALIRNPAYMNWGLGKAEADSWRKLIAVSRVVDQDPWRNSLRGLVGGNDLQALQRLAGDEKALAGQPARSLLLLAQLLGAQNNTPLAEKVLKRAWSLRPDDFWTCLQLARSSAGEYGMGSLKKERVRFASSAVSLRPGNSWAHLALAEALLASNEPKPLWFGSGNWGWFISRDRAGSDAMFKHFSSHEYFSGALGQTWFFLYPGNCRVLSTTPYFLSVNDEVITELKNAARLNPEEASAHRHLAEVLIHLEGRLDEAIVEYRQAGRLRPQDWQLRLEFAGHLFLIGRLSDAIPDLREALRIEPKNVLIRVFLGWVLQKKGNLHAAFAEFRKAFLLTDDDCCNSPPLKVLAGFLHATAQPEEEIAGYRERIRSHPDESFVITHLGEIFRSQGKPEEELAVYRDAIRLKPDTPRVHGLYARVLKRQEKPDQAHIESEKEIALYREAIRRNPGDAQAHQDYAGTFFDRGRWEEALKELREAIRIAPSSNPFSSVGMDFYSEGMVDQAVALYREAVRLKPSDSAAHNGLGYYLIEFGELDSALSEVRAALRAEPKNPAYLDSLGWAHVARGELKAALAALREATGLQTGPHDSETEAHLRLAERLAALEGRLDAILRGQGAPAEAERRLDVADLCRVTKRFAAASRFYREAFQAKPALADDLTDQHRLHAAIAAAQAGTSSNLTKDDLHLDAAERARWRAQSLQWLRAERNACAGIVSPTAPAAAGPIPAVTSGPPKLALARKTLDIMNHHRDLACVRDQKELARLPEPERKEWQAFWVEVAELLKKAEKS